MPSGAIKPDLAELSVLKPLTDPIVVNRPARSVTGPLRITLLNAQGAIQLEGITKCLRRSPLSRSSIILLCESDWGTHRAGGLETAKELAESLEMSFAYIPEFGIAEADGTFRSMLGNAILSASPLEDVGAVPIPLPHAQRVRRPLRGRVGLPAGLIVTIRVGTLDLTVGVVHLASHCGPADRDVQMAEYLANFPTRGPAIIGGDLNTTTTSLLSGREYLDTFARMIVSPWRFHAPQRYEPLFQRIAAANLHIEGVNRMRKPTFTFTRAIPPIFRPKLDWLAVRGIQPVEGSAAIISARPSFFSSRVSDHDFVTVELNV